MKNTLTLFLLLCITCTLHAQKRTEDFQLKVPAQKITNSLYNKITILDSRNDTTNFGVVQLGVFNTKARVVPKVPLAIQLQQSLDSITNLNAGQGELLLQLRRYTLAEVTSSVSERGYCFFRANLYSKENGVYKKLNSIDTIITFKAGDVTQKLLVKGGNAITDFVAANLALQATGETSYNLNHVQKIDSVEKSKIKLYNADQYVNGVYKTYTAFKNQEPTFPDISAKEEKGVLSKVKIKTANGEEKIKSKDVYAVVYDGEPFIATDYGYYHMYKIDDNIIFTGEVKVTANAEDVMAATFMLGILGGILASNTSDTFEMKIDHVNGSFIHLRKIPRPDNP
jgi:hypothetical protein